jgi:predicted acetyltransferase
MLIRGVPVRVGGIGSVATLPAYEGNGYATALLYDAIHEMHRLGMAASYLYTGRPGFYERVGFQTVSEPGFYASPSEAADVPHDRSYAARRAQVDDAPAMLRIYRSAIAGTTGAIVRTLRTWRDAETWIGLDPGGTLLAEHAGRPVAFMRSSDREYGYAILESEHLHGHEGAVTALLAAASSKAVPGSKRLVTLAPDDHPLATALRTLPNTTWSEDRSHVPYPMMMRVISIDRLLDALLPQLRERARTHRGTSFALTLNAPDDEQVTLAVSGDAAALRHRPGDYALDETATLDAILGQKRASRLVRPRPPRDVARRIDALLPETALHFWNSDRI